MMLKHFFDISTGFRFSKLQWGSVPSILVAVLVLVDSQIKHNTVFSGTKIHVMGELQPNIQFLGARKKIYHVKFSQNEILTSNIVNIVKQSEAKGCISENRANGNHINEGPTFIPLQYCKRVLKPHNLEHSSSHPNWLKFYKFLLCANSQHCSFLL